VSPSAPSNGSVISAIYHLGDRHQRTWPTAADIARYLEADESQVLACLRALRSQRLFRDRRRKGQRVWMPWGEA
jgi:hypothetical protein